MAEERSSSRSVGVGVSLASLSSLGSLLVNRNLNRAISGAAGGRRGVFELIDKDDEVQFDTSDTDNNREVLMTGKQYPSIQEFSSAIPNQLLLGSLLEHLCFVYERDPAQSRMLFKVIGQHLAAMNLLSPLAISDEFSSVRLQHSRAFSELLHAASSSLFPQDHRYLNAEGRKEELFQAQMSRYLSEFEEISTLGKGSYGRVFKVKNKLDGQDYAVKKIHIKNVTRNDCMKVLREVKVLSSLQHPNIVGYHTAWLEHVQPAATSHKSAFPSSVPALEASSQAERLEESSSSAGGSSIVFESSERPMDRSPEPTSTSGNICVKSTPASKDRSQAVCLKSVRNMPNFIPCVFLGKPRSAPDSCPALTWESSAPSEDEPSTNRLDHPNQVQFHLMLYIQMQLCARSLKDWIQERNLRPHTTSTEVYPTRASDILKKILEGVEYIHSCGIMHRDLKPRNIFLHDPECHVKIGDFGLACSNIVMDENEELPSTSSINGNAESAHTTGVGTFVYASPEQLKGSHYDSKSDMYSVGVIAVELFQPFGTEMERVRTLSDLRHEKIPDQLSENWPILTKYVKLLTSSDPSLRPSASHLLRSDLFSDKDMIIHSLQRKVDEQEEEIVQLRRQISELQSLQIRAHNLNQTVS